MDELTLMDWKRRIFALYAEVRAGEPRQAWERWRAVRNELFRTHPQSPQPGLRIHFSSKSPALTCLGPKANDLTT